MAAPVKSEKRGEMHLVASPVNMEGIPRKIHSATADAGEHTDEILASVGYTKAEIEKLRSAGVV
jgi:formyl-CoA transferase